MAILWRVLRLEGLADWKALWKPGELSTSTLLDSYLGQWHEQFDLLHPDRPFYQMPVD
jgi:CRISPR system Cascade subunit CasA